MARHRASGHTIGVLRGLWQAVFFIQTTYSDRICYHPDNIPPGCLTFGWSCSAAIPSGYFASGQHSTRMSYIRMELLRRHYTRMSHIRIGARRHYTRMSHIRMELLPPTFHPDVSHSAHSIWIFCIQTYPDAGWERSVFQLLRLDISRSSNSAYPESFATIFCTVPRCSPEASRYVPQTFGDILRYFALDICCLNPQNLLVTHQL